MGGVVEAFIVALLLFARDSECQMSVGVVRAVQRLDDILPKTCGFRVVKESVKEEQW